MDHSVWILQSRYFAFHEHNVMAVDLPGHGRSAGEPIESIEGQADWLAALIEVAGVGDAVVVGHSMGALAALDLASRYPDRVAGLVLTGAGLPMPVAEPLLEAARADDPKAWEMIMQWGMSPQSHLGGNQAPGLWMHGQGMRLLEQSRPGVLGADMGACNAYEAGLERAEAVECPVHLVIGDRDLMTPPRAAAALAGAVGGPTTQCVFRGCGHMTPLERPNELLDELVAFGGTAVSAEPAASG